MADKFYIPNKLTVGFTAEEKASTGKLVQITYKDANGRIIREKTWREIIDDEASPKKKFIKYDTDANGRLNYNKPIFKNLTGFPIQEIDNTPTKGFILNKSDKTSGWENRSNTCFFYDPRGFEVNLSLNNLLYILKITNGNYSNTSFVYSWIDDIMVLLPCSSDEYKNSIEFMDVKSMKFSLKDLKQGYVYNTKNLTKAIYIGRYDIIDTDHHHLDSFVGYRRTSVSKSHIFYVESGNKFISMTSTHLANVSSDKVVPNYKQLVEELEGSGMVLLPERIEITAVTLEDLLQKERDIPGKNVPSNIYVSNNVREHLIGYVTQPKADNKYDVYKLYQVRRYNGHTISTSININMNILGYKMKPSYQEYIIDGNNISVKNTKTIAELRNMTLDRTGAYAIPILSEEQVNALNLAKVKLKFKNSDKLKVI